MDLIEVLTWVGIVFIAGFIGYFGKYLSKLILARIHKTGEGKPDTSHELEKARLKAEAKKRKCKYKLEKKRLKEQKK